MTWAKDITVWATPTEDTDTIPRCNCTILHFAIEVLMVKVSWYWSMLSAGDDVNVYTGVKPTNNIPISYSPTVRKLTCGRQCHATGTGLHRHIRQHSQDCITTCMWGAKVTSHICMFPLGWGPQQKQQHMTLTEGPTAYLRQTMSCCGDQAVQKLIHHNADWCRINQFAALLPFKAKVSWFVIVNTYHFGTVLFKTRVLLDPRFLSILSETELHDCDVHIGDCYYWHKIALLKTIVRW